MRAYFKNDLYNFASHDPRLPRQSPEKPKYLGSASAKNKQGQSTKKIAVTKPRSKTDSKKDGIRKQEERKEKKMRQIKVDDNLELKFDKDQLQQLDFNLEQFKSLSKKQTNTPIKLISTQQSRKNQMPVVEEPKTAEKTQQEEKKEKISNFMQFKKLQIEMKKISKAQWEVDKTQKEKQLEKENGKQSKNEEQQAGAQGEKKQQNKQAEVEKQSQDQKGGKSKKKTKNIKKQKNYVRLDLKRTYRDRFVGALNSNLRFYGKNGRLKMKYRMPTELTLQDGEIYNTYISSLSKALTMNIILEDSDNEQGESSQVQAKATAPQIPSYYDLQSLTDYLKKAFGFQKFREGQYETICKIIDNQSVVFVSETASGKSLTYIMSSMIMNGLSMVVSPLVSLMLDQLTHLPPYFPAACISSLINRQQRDRIINMVKNGTVKLLFVTPQTLQTDFLYHLQDFPQMSFVCVDEAHCLSQLSHNFRTSFLGLGQILQKQIKYRNKSPVILALTATANPQTVASIQQRLNIDSIVRSESCMNKNLYITITKEKGSMKYEALIRYLQHPQITQCQGILIYTRTRKIMNEVYNYITNSTSIRTAMYHAALSNIEKTQTLTKFRQGEIKIVVATVALGMGLDFSHLECVIHLNMPKSIENYVQEIGRAGRRQKRAYCHLFLDQNDYITQRNYIIADELQKETLILLYEKLKQYSKPRKVRGEVQPSKRDQAELTVRRAALLIEHKGLTEAIEEQEVQDDEQEEEVAIPSGDLLKSKIFHIPIEKLTAFTKLREEALLTLLLKVEKQMKTGDIRLRVLPVSHELIKVGFFKNNEQKVKDESDFFRNLTLGCKRIKGTTYINVIDRCNRLGIRPIQLLTNLYRLGNTYMLKIELQSPIYVWQFQGKRRFTQQDQVEMLVKRGFDKLYQDEEIQKTLVTINEIQRVSLIKLNTFYSLAFLSAYNNINSIINKKLILPASKPIPADSIAKKFDDYFRANLNDYYNLITDDQKDIYIPTTEVDEKEEEEVYGCIVLFLRQEFNFDDVRSDLQRYRLKSQIYKKFEDGKVVTRILMGVNSGEVTWQIYGQRTYWMRFKTKNYQQLLQVVRRQLIHYRDLQLNK